MLRCYLLALCTGSSLDRDLNNLTLFNVVEQVTVSADFLGQVAPIEVHAYFMVEDASANNSEFEMRVIRTPTDGAEDFGGPLPFSSKDGPRIRVRVQSLRLPTAFGSYTLRLEWRLQGTTEWQAELVRWPLVMIEGVVAQDAAHLVVDAPNEPPVPPRRLA